MKVHRQLADDSEPNAVEIGMCPCLFCIRKIGFCSLIISCIIMPVSKLNIFKNYCVPCFCEIKRWSPTRIAQIFEGLYQLLFISRKFQSRELTNFEETVHFGFSIRNN